MGLASPLARKSGTGIAGDLLLPAPKPIGGDAEISGDLGSRMPTLRRQFHGLAFEFLSKHSSESTHDDHLLGEHASPFSRCPLFPGKIKQISPYGAVRCKRP